MSSDRDWGTELALVSLALIWGVNFPVLKVVLAELHPFVLNALRFTFASALLYALLRVVRPTAAHALPAPADRLRIVGLGILGNVLYQFFFIVGVDLTSAGNASLLLATVPIWTLLLSVGVGHERPPPAVWVGIAATVAGMALVVTGGARGVGGGDPLGDLLIVCAAVSWSFYTVGARDLVRRYGALSVTAWTLWVGTAGLILQAVPWLVEADLGAVGPRAWAGVAYTGGLAISVAYLIWYRGVQRIGNARTAVYSNLVPVVTLAAAWIWLDEVPRPLQLLGAAIVLAGLTLTRRTRRLSPG